MAELFGHEKLIAYNALVLRSPFSGVEKSVVALARALTARKHFGYRIIATDESWAALASVAEISDCMRPPAWCRGRVARIFYELALLPRRLRREPINLFHAPAYVAPPRLRCPLVLSIYDLHVFTHPHFCTLANRLHYRARIPHSIRRADAIIVPSQATRRALATLFPEADAKTHVIPLGVSPAYFASISTTRQRAVATRYGLPARYLLFVGDLAPRKNLGGVQRAWELLRQEEPDLCLVLVGSPTGATISARPGLLITGYVDDADLPAIYAQARALLFPSFDEGFGLPVLEAMAAGCPVVCSDGASREFAADAVRYCDPADIAAQTRPLLADNALREAQIAEGRRQAAHFTWERAAQATEAVYEEVLRQS